METVLITGAGGYIGSNAAEYFAKAGYRVVGTIHRHVVERLTQLGVKTISVDLADAANLPRLFEEKIDYVVHIAARASDVGREEWFREANYEAVKNLAAAAMEHGVKRFVYLSTADVYGLHDFSSESEDGLSFDEAVMNPYPKYKILSEKWLAANLPRERFSCVRPCVVYGRGDTSITPRTVAYLKNSPLVFHFGKWCGRNRWPLAHVENVWEFLPGKRLRECCLPMWAIRPVAWLSTALSRNRNEPLFDPTLYALDTVAHNLDFSNARMLGWFAKMGMEEFRHDSYR